MRRFTINFSCFILGVAIIMTLNSCVEDALIEPNPFEENINNQDTVQFMFDDIDPNSIAGLYQNIFGKTCANVGCHDGTFEPDFRTIESSYHSMVYRTPIKNDGSLTFRVDPGNPNQSAIVQRLAGTITPKMPIEIEPDSDWLEKSDEYIQNVRTWIEDGALDLSGNAPQPNYINPNIIGAMATADGVILTREDTYGTILIPDSVSNIQLYIGFDPINDPTNFSVNELMFGKDHELFTADTSIVMEIMDDPIFEFGLYGEMIDYTHKIDALFSTSGHYFMRIRVQEESNPIIEIPTDDGLYYIKEYMSFTLVD
jgi:hypothetical protein